PRRAWRCRRRLGGVLTRAAPGAANEIARSRQGCTGRFVVITSSMLNIYVRDMSASIRFYRDHLGAIQTYQYPYQGQPEHVELRLGESMLALSTHAAVAAQGVAAAPGQTFELELW